jgi:hypothetical protein
MVPFAMRPDTWGRMVRAVERVEERLLGTCATLETAGIEYAVIGGNAVAAWVATVDEGATRNTPEVNLLVRREDFPAVVQLMTAVGFDHSPSDRHGSFVDRPDGSLRSGVHFTFAGEFVRPDDPRPSAELTERMRGPKFWLISLEPLVRMKLTAWRMKDRVHIRDLIGVGLIDDTWPDRFPPVLADRLREILADPDG